MTIKEKKEKEEQVSSVFFRDAFATCLRILRTQKKMTLKELSEASSVDLQALYRYERGQVDISAYNAYKLSKALGVSMEDLCVPSDSSFDSSKIMNLFGVSSIVKNDDVLITVYNSEKPGKYKNCVLSRPSAYRIVRRAIDICTPLMHELIISGIMKAVLSDEKATDAYTLK